MFYIHSTVSHPRKRTQRALAPVHLRRKQYVLDTTQRLLPNRPLAVSEETLERNLEHLKLLEAHGIIEVRTSDGRYVHLHTGMVETHPPVPPVPHPLLDSAKNDPPRGQTVVPEKDNSEPLQESSAGFSGGGMTEEAMAAAEKARIDELATQEELALLDAAADGDDVTDSPVDPAADTEMSNAFGDKVDGPLSTPPEEIVEEDSEEVPHTDTKPAKSRRSRK